MEKFKKRLNNFFFTDDGGKKVINRSALLLSASPLLIAILFTFLKEAEVDTSFVENGHGRASTERQVKESENRDDSNGPTKQVLGVSQKVRSVKEALPSRAKSYPAPPKQINYRAKQVISRTGFNSDTSLPIGTNAIGKLITSIDTRQQNQHVKVLLPYGISYKGERRLERNTTLFGNIQYPGNGNKVFLVFTKGLTPEGTEFKINAQALNSSDYSPGLVGVHHGNADVRIATTLGLSLVSGMAEVMTEKEALGQAGVVTAKSSMKNALYHGASRAAEMEATRQAGELTKEPEYATVAADSALIVELTSTFQGVEAN